MGGALTMQDVTRKIIVSPEINTPEPFVGFGGFCGWPKVCRLRNGDLYVVFCAGYWHASFVNPDPHGFPGQAAYMAQAFESGDTWHAPTGGHIMWTRSSDQGATWTRPRDLCVLPHAYAPGDVTQASDGTLYMAALVQKGWFRARRIREWFAGRGAPPSPLDYLRTMDGYLPEEVAVFRSEDNGESWAEAGRTSGPFRFTMEHPNAMVESRDGALFLHLSGTALPPGMGEPDRSGQLMALVRSRDRGRTWDTWSTFGDAERDMNEAHVARLPDGRLGTGSRPWSLWTMSDDEGKTWSDPRPLFDLANVQRINAMKKGDLLTTPDGMTVMVTCGIPGGNGQVLYSRDSGETWVLPQPDRGFTADEFAYYPSACTLEDGSIFMVGDHQGFPNCYGPYGAEVIATRFRIRSADEGDGVEILPISGTLHDVSLTDADRHRRGVS